MKKIFSIIFLLFTFSLYAETITEQRARDIAVNFFNSVQTKSASVEVDLVWSGNDLTVKSSAARFSQTSASLPSIYIFNRTDGEGFVVVAGDDRVRPILAYSRENSFDLENMADGARFILSCWCEQVEEVRSRQGQERFSESEIISALAVGDECLYTTPLWGQGAPFNKEAPVMEGQRCVTGCLATAMSIIAYYNQWPVSGSGTTPAYTCSYNDNTYTIPANVLGRTYDYASMLSDYRSGYTEAQANAVAALMKDAGTALKMKYSPIESSANYSDALYAFTHYFGYCKSAKLEMASNYQYDEWVEVLKDNLENYGPTFYSGQSGSDGSGGHAFVLDGYDNQDYFHINFGWDGTSNAYYYLPTGMSYRYYQRAILGLEPDETGTSTYTDHLLAYWANSDYPGIRSDAAKYVKNQPFNIYFGGVLNVGMMPFEGNFAIRLYDKNGTLKETLIENMHFDESLSPNYWGYMDNPYPVTITKDIEPGDRLKVYYDGLYSDWQLLRPYNSNAVSEIVVMALNAEEIQKSLNIQYMKSTRALYFYSNMALTVSVEDEMSQTVVSPVNVPSKTTSSVSMASMEGGTYKVVFASGSVEYELTLVLPEPTAEPVQARAAEEVVVDLGKALMR